MILLNFLVINLLGRCILALDDIDDPLENPYLFEGDIELDYEKGNDRSSVVSGTQLWPNGVIPFVVEEEDLNKTISKECILAAIKEYNTVTCLKFIPKTNEESYIRFITGKGCHKKVGYRGGEHRITLGRGCNQLGTVLHEIGHAIGFYHEHTRSDRHEYIKIIWENIIPGKEDQFRQRSPGTDLLLSPFDFNSTMLYDSYSFSVDKGRLLTMVSLVQHRQFPKVKTRLRLSSVDILRANKLYGCD